MMPFSARISLGVFCVILVTGCKAPWQKAPEYNSTSSGLWVDGCTVTYRNKELKFGSSYLQVVDVLGEPGKDERNESPDGKKTRVYWNDLGLTAHFNWETQRLSSVVAYFELKYDMSSGEEIFPADTEYKKQLLERNLSSLPKTSFRDQIIFEGAPIGVQFDHLKLNDIRAEYHRQVKGNLNTYVPIDYRERIFGAFWARNDCGGDKYVTVEFNAYNRPKPYELHKFTVWGSGF